MILNIIQIVLSILVITFILLQHRGSGLGSAFGGENAVYRTKRGMEKTLHYATIIVVILFLAASLFDLFV